MAFLVAATLLGGFTLYNLAGTKNTLHVASPQERLDNTPGNKHGNYKIYELFTTYMAPLLNYPTPWMATETYSKRVRARMRQASDDKMISKMGTVEVAQNNYHRYQGHRDAIGKDNSVSATSYWS